MVQPPFEIFLVRTWLRVPIWSGTVIRDVNSLGWNRGNVPAHYHFHRSLDVVLRLSGLAIFTDIDVVQSSLSKIIMPIVLRTEFRILISSVAISFSYLMLDSKHRQIELTLQAYLLFD